MKNIIIFLIKINLISSILQTISIIAFFTAINIFSTNPSVKTQVLDELTKYDMGVLREFYIKNEFTIPKIILNSGLGDLIKKDTSLDVSLSTGFTDSDIILIQKLKVRNLSGGLLSNRIEKLKNYLDTNRYFKHIYMTPSPANQTMKENITDDFLEVLEKQVSNKEYYIFLTALTYARVQYNQISITNNGDVDLIDFNLYIPAPVSKIIEKRDNNILNVEWLNDNIINHIKHDPLGISINVPRLNRDENFLLQIQTRENIITKEDLKITYNSTIKINKMSIFIWCIGLLTELVNKNETHFLIISS